MIANAIDNYNDSVIVGYRRTGPLSVGFLKSIRNLKTVQNHYSEGVFRSPTHSTLGGLLPEMGRNPPHNTFAIW